MSLSVPVQKNLAEYEPKLFGKLTKRTAISITLAVGLALVAGVYLNVIIRVDIDEYGWLVLAASAPGWLIGFWRPDKMRPEAWLPLWFKHSFADDEVIYRRLFTAQDQDSIPGKEGHLVLKDEKKLLNAITGNGAERMCPKGLF